MNEMNLKLINTAKGHVEKHTDGDNHTVAAAVLTKNGKLFTAMNFYHFTGGYDAEIVVLARLLSEDEYPEIIVAVGDNNRGVLPPCGRCRQIIFDYYPDMKVIISDDGIMKTIKELLPDTYDWNAQQNS